jgi:hypothetical protein
MKFKLQVQEYSSGASYRLSTENSKRTVAQIFKDETMANYIVESLNQIDLLRSTGVLWPAIDKANEVLKRMRPSNPLTPPK